MTAPVDLAAVEKACEADVCTCFPVMEPWTYYGTVEPGGAIVPNPECPVHFPNAALIALSRTAMPAMAAAIRAVLALHHCLDDQRWPECLECRSAWPCETVLDIAEHVQVTL